MCLLFPANFSPEKGAENDSEAQMLRLELIRCELGSLILLKTFIDQIFAPVPVRCPAVCIISNGQLQLCPW